jgi:GntR family transcriptional repressor for pyruvate dehydrogenase complex
MSLAHIVSSEPSAVDSVVDGLLATIVEAGIMPGAVLPPERELAEQFEVSRLTIREAMKTLATLGVVTVKRGSGTFVNPESHWSRFHSGVLASLVRDPSDAAEASRQLVEARRLVEVGVAELAATRRRDHHVEALMVALDAMWDSHEITDCDAWASADLAFHDTLMDAAGNPFVTLLFAPLEELLRRDRHGPAADGGNRSRALRWHQRILDAVRARDASAARSAMDGHLRDTEQVLARWRSSDGVTDAGDPAHPPGART